ncbi:expressed unknown protein [Seminavis robusta]|uniref:Uncharacterized protein n=1 Tax=Seminavis robusta TaxID=568900 RepID=A0A9N8DMX6_9STRA|nr:expressed unknown protein [Seminavis robusta]|eukprot:Sro167_g074420.1 n/a (688) ;mRNA; r:31008-33071
MALGMTKDSMVDLQSLVQEKEIQASNGADTVSLLTTGLSHGSQKQYQKLAVDTTTTAAEDKDYEEIQPSLATEQALRSNSIKAKKDGAGETSSPKQLTSPQGALSEGGLFIDAQEEKKQEAASYGQYSGFANDYDSYDYDSYGHFQYHQSPQTLLGGSSNKSKGFLCCLFPWLQQPAQQQQPTDQEEAPVQEDFVETKKEQAKAAPMRKPSSGDDDDVSTGDVSVGSDKLGERLSDRDRQAVLARLRLAQPDGGSSESAGGSLSPGSSNKEKIPNKGLLKDIPNISAPASTDEDARSDISTDTGTKSILKRQSVVTKTPESQSDSRSGGGKPRRSLFPTYETTKKKKNRDDHIQFAPMARVVTVKSQKDMTAEEKSSIWWQRWDYEDFRKTGRIITRAMLEGGSEIWLASNQSWRHQGMSKTATLKNAISMTEDNAAKAQNGSDSSDLIRSTGDKWWHKFGHSRRGLEHIASIKEGSERQANVKHAIRAVLDEQKRHKAYLREDPEKLRMVSIHHTSWARDLALAAGSSDMDAVKSNFDEERKSREFYLLKMARSNSISSKGKHVPKFMQPAMNTFAQKLDANTSAQIMYRRKQQRTQQQRIQQQTAAPAVSKPSKRASMPPLAANGSKGLILDPPEDKDAKQDALSTQNLAKRAAGFSHDGAEQVNMAAVLSGMGAVPKSAQPVGA